VKFPAARVDRVFMLRATDGARDVVEHHLNVARKLTEDPQKSEREARSLCRCCFYVISSAGGAAITEQPCGLCLAPQSYGSTNTDVLCLPCAREHSLCKRCGGDRDMRVRRRNWPERKG